MNPSKSKKRAAHSIPTAEPSRGRPTLSEWLAVKLDMPADALDGGIRLDLRGRNTLTVHGCTGILHFSPEEISRKYEDRLYSRLLGSETTVLPFVGRDHRLM